MAPALGSALLLALALAAPPDTLVVGTLADPGRLEPHRVTDVVGTEIVANVCETLVRLRPASQRPEAVLATAWATADQKAWTFTLREGVRFQDGARLDADVVVANFEHLRRERAFGGRAVRIGPLVVEIVLDRANAALLQTLSQPFFGMQSPRALSGPRSQVPVGSGPFRLAKRRPGLVELVRYDGYWGGAPRLHRVVFRRFPSADALVRALRSGEVDVSSAVGPAQVALLRRDPDVTLDSQTGLNLIYLALNDERPPFDQVRVRQAVSRAIDRARLVRDVLFGHGEPADTPLPPTLFERDTRARELVLDRSAAHRLLAQAGLPDGFDTILTVSRAPRPYLTEPVRVAERLRDDLSQVGVRASLREIPTWSEHVETTSRGDFDMALLGWQADSLDPNDFLTALLDSSLVGKTNRSRYSSAAMDGLLKRARMDSAPSARLALYRRAQDLFQKDMPFVPLFHASVFTAHRREVSGLVIGPTGILRYDKTWKQP
jgi:peptide/nickel transport system substrate-binding protein